MSPDTGKPPVGAVAAEKVLQVKSEANAPVIDYPKEGERIVSPAYGIRLTAADAGAVELSIDGSEWRLCRPASGYWWYDWSGYKEGPHELLARLRPHAGQKAVSQPRRITVELTRTPVR